MQLLARGRVGDRWVGRRNLSGFNADDPFDAAVVVQQRLNPDGFLIRQSGPIIAAIEGNVIDMLRFVSFGWNGHSQHAFMLRRIIGDDSAV